MRLSSLPSLLKFLIAVMVAALALSSIPACGDSGAATDESSEKDDEEEDDDDDEAEKKDDDDDDDDDDEAKDDDDADDDEPPREAKKPSKPIRKPIKSGGSAKEVAKQFRYWAPMHAFLGASVVGSKVLSGSEAIALTKDNHVGVTSNAGASWGFIRHTTGVVLAVGGQKGGPYLAAGKGGYVAVSKDGKEWTGLPKYTADDLIDVALVGGNVVAIGKKGSFVSMAVDGSGGVSGPLPDKYKGKALVEADGELIAISGKKGYSTRDGKAWTKLEALPPLPDVKAAKTSKGVCKLGKVGKKKGVVCEVTGMAHGVAANTFFVEDKGVISFTKDGGSSWSVSTLAFKGASAVIGSASGPYYAFGPKGSLAKSADGASWTTIPLNSTKKLWAGMIDGSTILIVGDGGTVVRSADGGESWAVLPPPISGSFQQIVKRGNKIILPAGKKGIFSTDGGATWLEVGDPTELEGIGKPAKPAACEGRLPNPGETCKFKGGVTTPLGLPNVKAFSFRGDVGLGTGDQGLVAMTTDGGASWKATYGYSFRYLEGFDLKGDRAVAVGGKTVIFTTDGGVNWREAQLPKAVKGVSHTLITDDGSVYACGKGGVIIKSEGKLNLWLPLNTGEKNKTAFIKLFDLSGVLYASGAKGELYRSRDAGASWAPVPTGVNDSIVAMTGDGDTVLAVASPSRGKTGNLLLRSDDGGLHFYVQREISHQGRVYDFELDGDTLRYNDRVSDDYGAVWTEGFDNYWGGAKDLGNGYRIHNSYYNYSKDRLFILGEDKDDWAIVDSAFNEGAWFRCEPKSGCWMVTGGQVYRPL